ncbi:unnamed protein product [Arabis nemorensis]|uniref:NYN domain-containing protein n=1 Tax=Arabis nemorensis TaxID=586526 RepID=A0A565CG03_9BRAS|nr:unnamed protein product [Arabis nemorensis]
MAGSSKQEGQESRIDGSSTTTVTRKRKERGFLDDSDDAWIRRRTRRGFTDGSYSLNDESDTQPPLREDWKSLIEVNDTQRYSLSVSSSSKKRKELNEYCGCYSEPRKRNALENWVLSTEIDHTRRSPFRGKSYNRIPSSCPPLTSQLLDNELSQEQKEKDLDVIWDYESSEVPYDVDKTCVCEEILKILREKGFVGKIRITIVLGYLDSIPENVLTDLYKNKGLVIEFAHHYNHQAADIFIINLFETWVRKKIPPQNVILVTCDNGYKNSLELLRKAKHFTIAIVRDLNKIVVSLDLVNTAELVWDWRTFFGLGEGECKKKRSQRRLFF